jgi:transposase
MKKTAEILEKILLPLNSSWNIIEVKVDESSEEIEVVLEYSQSDITVDKECYKIYDHRPFRRWRHLDLWQYKTFITARLPRYKDSDGAYRTVEVPWADPSEQMSILLQKKF